MNPDWGRLRGEHLLLGGAGEAVLSLGVHGRL